ncbi:MAG: fibrobacter succinogenes major paralogous domain-containing protein [Dysgonamonadaceae bacterium]|nr:fibrobacter succinogenes major paralogous domain-containing protein [Dysgonamonadaceae bacterium]
MDDGHYYQSTAWQMPSNNPCPAGFRVPTQDEWERIAAYDCEPDKEGGAKTMSTGSVPSYDMTETGLTWVRVKSGYASNESWSSGDHTGWAIYKTSDWNVAGANYKGGTDPLYASGAPEPLLFLPAAGYRYLSSGSLRNVGYYGYYWSSSVNGSNGRSLSFDRSYVNPNYSTYRAGGFSVRCVAEY